MCSTFAHAQTTSTLLEIGSRSSAYLELLYLQCDTPKNVLLDLLITKGLGKRTFCLDEHAALKSKRF